LNTLQVYTRRALTLFIEEQRDKLASVWLKMDGDASQEIQNDQEEYDVLNGSTSKLNVDTVRDAYNIIVELTKEQIRLAKDLSTPFNVSIQGDAVVKLLIKTLLPLTLQRRVYVECMNSLENASRSTCIFGAPPYPFLLPTDNHVFNASGMARRRVNMAYSTSIQRSIVNVAHFGAPHMNDTVGRDYRVVQDNQPDDSPIALNSLDTHSTVDMYVRLKSRKKRSRDQDQLATQHTPPKIGETLQLTSSKFLKKVLDQNYAVTCVVKAIRMEKNTARVCLIRVHCTSKHTTV
jgi:hypothetical protein